MSTLSKKLRSEAKESFHPGHSVYVLLSQAATEIEKLEQELSKLKYEHSRLMQDFSDISGAD